MSDFTHPETARAVQTIDPTQPAPDSHPPLADQHATATGQPGTLTVDQLKLLATMMGMPWANEVDGVPATAAARPGDDAAISQTVTDKHWVAGKDGVGRQSTVTTTEDGKTTVDDKKTTVGYDKDNQGVSLNHSDAHTNKYSEKVESTHTTTSGVGVGANGVKITAGEKDEKKAGENKHETGTSGTASVGMDGKVNVGVGTTDKREDAHGSVETGRKISVGSDGLKIDLDKTTEHKIGEGEDAKTTSNKVSGGVTVGPNKLGAEGSATHTTAGGSSYGVKGGVEYEDGNIKGNVGGTFKDARGNSASLSVSGGVSVACSDPVQVGNQWLVSYKKSKSIGAGGAGSSHGVGVSLGVEKDSFVEGTRKFSSKEKALEFKEHAAEEIKEEKDFNTVDGLKDIPIGESRGEGGSKSGNVGGSASLEGASFGYDKTKQKTTQLDVKRLSENVVQVTYYEQNIGAGTFNVGGMGVTANRGSGDGEHSGITYQFDISTPEGVAAYEKYCRDREPPAQGGTFVSKEHGVDSDDHDGMKIALLGGAEWTYGTKQNTVTDDKNEKHQTVTGEMQYDLNPKWLDRKLSSDKEFHEKVDLETHVDKTGVTGGTISAHMSGEDGAKTREELDKMVGVHEQDVGDVKPSGEWTVSAEIPKEMMKDELMGKGKTPSDQARAEAKEFAESKDHWERKVQDIASYGERDPKLHHMKLDWNVELKGDSNFTGAAGRAHNQELIQKFKTDLECNAGDPALAISVNTEIERLRTQRKAVDPASNPDQYKDLPVALRQGVVSQIDADLAQFEDLRHQALVDANKTKATETPEELKARMEKEKGKDDPSKSPLQKLLDDVRNQIALADAEITADDKESEKILYALDIDEHDLGYGHNVDFSHHHYTKERDQEYRKDRADGEKTYQQHVQAMKALDEQRMLLLKMMAEPAAALPFAYMVLGSLKREGAAAASARRELEWANEDINKMMGNDEQQEADDKADDEEKAEEAKPTPMTL
jgi:hypothetical protein